MGLQSDDLYVQIIERVMAGMALKICTNYINYQNYNDSNGIVNCITKFTTRKIYINCYYISYKYYNFLRTLTVAQSNRATRIKIYVEVSLSLFYTYWGKLANQTLSGTRNINRKEGKYVFEVVSLQSLAYRFTTRINKENAVVLKWEATYVKEMVNNRYANKTGTIYYIAMKIADEGIHARIYMQLMEEVRNPVESYIKIKNNVKVKGVI